MSKPDRKNYSKTLKNLKHNAAKGNVLSMFELFQNYSTGKNVEAKDEVKAQEYLDQIAEKLSASKFTVNSIELYEFRRLRKIIIAFDKKLTVIIGNNGAGKTSIVEALAKTLSWFNNNLVKDANGRPVTPADVNVNSDDFAEVTTNIQFNQNTSFETNLFKAVAGYPHSKETEVRKIKNTAAIYRHLIQRNNIDIPLLVFYSVERSDFKLNQSIAESATLDVSNNRLNGLDTNLDGDGKLDNFSQLYIELVNLAEGETASEVKALREDINKTEALIKDAYQDIEPPPEDRFVLMLNNKKLALEEALKKNCSTKHQNQLNFVNQAIETVVPEVTNFEVDRSSGKVRLMVNNFGNRVNIALLSQGQKTLVALVGDIARRLVVLNPESELPLHGHGVIIIDEIELHLHPKWQQTVLGDLQEVFPNIQFIVTTHSPQVLSHIDPKHANVIKLSSGVHDVEQTTVRETYGKNADRIYEDNMDVSARPKAVQNKLDDVFNLIDERKLDEAKRSISELKADIGEDGQLVKASTLIKRIEMIGK